MKTKSLLMTASFEPIWFGACRIEASNWGPFINDLEVFSTRIALLESLLEGMYLHVLSSAVPLEQFALAHCLPV